MLKELLGHFKLEVIMKHIIINAMHARKGYSLDAIYTH